MPASGLLIPLYKLLTLSLTNNGVELFYVGRIVFKVETISFNQDNELDKNNINVVNNSSMKKLCYNLDLQGSAQ